MPQVMNVEIVDPSRLTGCLKTFFNIFDPIPPTSDFEAAVAWKNTQGVFGQNRKYRTDTLRKSPDQELVTEELSARSNTTYNRTWDVIIWADTGNMRVQCEQNEDKENICPSGRYQPNNHDLPLWTQTCAISLFWCWQGEKTKMDTSSQECGRLSSRSARIFN